jgi:hypothetical protein
MYSLNIYLHICDEHVRLQENPEVDGGVSPKARKEVNIAKITFLEYLTE